ncbi:hypothetical protein MUS_4130 [Bacillus velezensis YAU B9601-Y2]|uniref:Uncharacterized protein n=1 Tax=Bacillus amyloliquefaciens (strain Y2) TaxID=1155777 RepID=I2CBE8_BACAY|nr:hypothetical protein MUS_4130 [Bacillus velezensis YAU B9601-Y2]
MILLYRLCNLKTSLNLSGVLFQFSVIDFLKQKSLTHRARLS